MPENRFATAKASAIRFHRPVPAGFLALPGRFRHAHDQIFVILGKMMETRP
jgi:hypothetical protein